MQSPIRKGDKLEHGGEVTGGSPWFEVMGRPLARKGDEAICERHGPTTIDEGYAKFSDRDGKEVAFHHYRCACGCRKSLTEVLAGKQTKIALNSGGASLEIEGGNMTFHCPGAFRIKAASFTFVGPDNVPTQLSRRVQDQGGLFHVRRPRQRADATAVPAEKQPEDFRPVFVIPLKP